MLSIPWFIHLQYFSTCSFCTWKLKSGRVLNSMLQDRHFGGGCCLSLWFLIEPLSFRSIPQMSHLNFICLWKEFMCCFNLSLPENFFPHSSHSTWCNSWTILWCLCILLCVVNTLAHTLHSEGFSGFLRRYNSLRFCWTSVNCFWPSSLVSSDGMVTSFSSATFAS